MLATVWPKVQAEAAKRGLPQPPPKKTRRTTPYLLLKTDQADRLLADQRRRAKDRRQGIGPPVLAGDYADEEEFHHALRKRLAACPDRAHRIALLIQQFEEEQLEQEHYFRSSGGCDGSPLTALLLCGEGEATVEPLLACLESDHRLTRWPLGERPFPGGVHLLAEATLQQVLKMPFHEPPWAEEEAACDKSENQQAAAAKIRAYWKSLKDVPAVERWYRTLADDQAEPDFWFAATRAILQPASDPLTLESMTWERGAKNWRVRDRCHVHGDALRNKKNPTVAELMARRVKSLDQMFFDLLAKQQKSEEEDRKKAIANQKAEKDRADRKIRLGALPSPRIEFVTKSQEAARNQDEDLQSERRLKPWKSLEQACDMAFCLAEWDLPAAMPVLREQSEVCRQIWTEHSDDPPEPPKYVSGYRFQRDPSFKTGNRQAGEYLVPLLLARAKAGDRKALDEYAQWLGEALGRTSTAPKGPEVSRRIAPLIDAIYYSDDWTN